MLIGPSHLPAGIRIIGHAWKRLVLGPKRYGSDAKGVCKAIVEACWDPRGFFRTSLHNYPEFYARDFGLCVESLVELGHTERVRQTLRFALDAYRKHGRFRLVVTGRGRCYDFPNVYAPDGFALLLHSLVTLGDESLTNEYRDFLNAELQRFADTVVDEVGLAKGRTHFSGMRDYAVRDSSCYDSVMCAAVQRYATALGLQNAHSYNYEDLILRYYWRGDHFADDRSSDAFTGDANVAPFWFRVVPQERAATLFRSVLDRIIAENLEQPLPLRYEARHNSERRMIWLDTFTGSWEQEKAWLHLGNMFLQVLARFRPEVARHYVARQHGFIEQLGHYPEVLDTDGRPHHGFFVASDDSMLWAANYLTLAPFE